MPRSQPHENSDFLHREHSAPAVRGHQPRAQNKLKADPVGTVQEFTSVRDSNVGIYRVVVSSLGLAVLGIITGIVVLIIRMDGLEDKNVLTVLTA